MARIRYLKPEFFKDEDLAVCPLTDRMTYAGLWCQADREGRLEYRPKYLKAEIWPYDDVDMEAVLQHLADPKIPGRPDKAFIVIYEISGRKYIQIVEFLKHQKPHHTERDSTIPPNGEITVKEPLRDSDPTVQAPLPDSGKPVGMEKGKLKENGEWGVSSKLDGVKPPLDNGELTVPYQEIVADLNIRTGKNFKAKTENTQRLINGRWAEGYRLPDFVKVHEIKVSEWKDDPKYKKYLQPATLYAAKHFESYLNQGGGADGHAAFLKAHQEA